jgi:hypothetical protein
MKCSYVVDQYSGGNVTVQKSVYANQETETYVHRHMDFTSIS